MKKLIPIMLFLFVFAGCSKDDGKLANFNPDPKAGDPATDFLYPDIKENPFRLSDKKGSVVILYFWRMKCAECRKELDTLEALNKKYRDKGLVIAAINEDSMHSAPLADVLDLIDKHGLTFINVRDDNGFVSEAYNVLRAPQAYVIDRNGTIASVEKESLDWMNPNSVILMERLINAK